MGEGEPGVHHHAAELGGVCVEVVMSTKRAGWKNKVGNRSKKASLIARNQQLSFTVFHRLRAPLSLKRDARLLF